MSMPMTRFWIPIVLGVVCGLAGWGVVWLVPSLEFRAYDWRLAHRPAGVQDSRLVLVSVDDRDPLHCGPDQWNRLVLARVIAALGQAQAAAIAPMVPLEGVPPSECGGVPGEARLIEATKPAGTVVYPETVPEPLEEAARRVGTLHVEPDPDGVVRHLRLVQGQRQPLGLVLGSVMNQRGIAFPPGEWLIPFVGRWREQPFSLVPFSTVWDFIRARRFDELAHLVEGRAVMLFPQTSSGPGIPTPLEPSAPAVLIHATILNATVTDAWLRPVSWPTSCAWSILLAVIASWFVFRLRGLRGWLGVGLSLLAYLAVVHASDVFWRLVLPVPAVFVAVAAAGVGTQAWVLIDAHRHARAQLNRARAQLARLRDELVGKEAMAAELENELQQVRAVARESSEKLGDVSAAEARASEKLRAAQAEVLKTRERIRRLERAIEELQTAAPIVSSAPEPETSAHDEPLRRECQTLGIVTNHATVLEVFRDLKKAAQTQSPVLLLGETGTGKELFARALHRLSPRARGPFVPVNMAAIRGELFEGELFGDVKGAFTGAVGRRGLLEAAAGGTIFLDEIGELGLELQAKLLRVLDSGTFYRVGESKVTQVDVRIVAATNRDLYTEVQAGRFREDLYYRLCSLVFRLPSLRERGSEDIALLAHHLVRELCAERGKPIVHLSQGAMAALTSHAWPGNIRELRHVLAQAVTMCEGQVIAERELRLDNASKNPVEGAVLPTVKEGRGWQEDEAVLTCLRRHRFDMRRTAQELGWDRSTVTQRLKGIGFQTLVAHDGDIHAAAMALAGDPALVAVVESRLREYSKNLIPRSFDTVEQAIADCRKRMRNLPERYFSAVETLVRRQFAERSHVRVESMPAGISGRRN